ncbi:DNA repair exonuclease [Ruminiclostridium herbifermentans]|uniref:DNA repair exonuclease n=1 Tax=Ruminiclostridium herbifermentans TaxID=2488810 RepID=A0A4U7JI87_9FIRM|nr:DNA repair exonuclease [Ruminiclostridium herbifermentans]QNU67011.1 DNA repair exonuclease [Ruminiclostridium herbifermentans]
MKQVSFIHIADLHLDAALSTLGDENKANIRRNELIKCLQIITERIIDQNIDLLIISGDFFEDKYVRGSTILAVKNLFSELYKTDVIICPGNHDPLEGNSYYRTSEWGSNVHILDDSQQVLYLEKYNTCIYNIGSRGNVKKDYSIVLNKELSNDKFNILLFHGTVDMPFEEDNYNPITSKEIFSLGMDYVALGHMHCYSHYNNGKTVMINPGSPEPLGFDEEGQHGFVQGKLTLSEGNQKRVETEFIAFATRHYHNVEIDISECLNDIEVVDRINSDLMVKMSSADFYSISLKGFISKEYKIEIRNIIDALNKKCFYIRIKNNTSVKFDYDKYLEDPGIKGEFVRRIMDMQVKETSEVGRETLFMALQYGLQALENGRVD